MADNPVTHEHLASSLAALNERFGRHEGHFQTVSDTLFKKIDRAIDLTHKNSVHIAAIQSEMSSILSGRTEHLDRLKMVEEKVGVLQLSDSVRQGERGVIATVAKSPFVTAVVSAIVAVGAVILAGVKGLINNAPVVILSMACMVLLTASAFAKPVEIVSVHDGDTLTVRGQWAVMDGRKVLFRVPGPVNVRLLGIDTPEMGARAKCDAERAAADRARDNLRAMAQGKADMGPASHDKYGGRLLADIKVNGRSLSAAQIDGGYAVAYTGEGQKKDWCA